MATFTLDTSTLAASNYIVTPFDLAGTFRLIRLTLSQGGLNQDFEPRGLELHYTVGAVSKE